MIFLLEMSLNVYPIVLILKSWLLNSLNIEASLIVRSWCYAGHSLPWNIPRVWQGTVLKHFGGTPKEMLFREAIYFFLLTTSFTPVPSENESKAGNRNE